MDWYYAHNGQQAGPVSEAELDQLVSAGTVTATTLVWRKGLVHWQPYERVRPPVATPTTPPAPPLPFDQQRCVECERAFGLNDVLRYENVYVCAECKPLFFQKLREGIAPGLQVWRSGPLLVLRKETELPPRCLRCGGPPHGSRIKRSLAWHAPWIYALLPAGIIIYAVVAAVVGKRAIVNLPLCLEHRRLRQRDLLITWVLIFCCLGAFGYAMVASSLWFALVGLSVLLAAAIYGSLRTSIVTPKRIDDEFVWLKGVAPEYLAPLPEFPHQR